MRRIVLAASILVFAASPLFAWYYFTASNGQRQQWVFGSSCNSGGSRPITMIYDSDIAALPAAFLTALTTVMNQWNAPGGNILCPTATCDPTNATYQRTMNASAVAAFLANPTPNQIWVVWDTDGSVFNSIGVDPNSSILGVGTGLTLNSSRPQDLCSGILFLNKLQIGNTAGNAPTFQRVALHELGHVLGFAHSVAGLNLGNVTIVGTYAGLPVMYPYLYPTSPLTLNPDDTAAVRTLYAP